MAPFTSAAPDTRPPPTAHSRRSVFVEAPMEEYTPAHSTYERSVRGTGGRSWSEICERRWAKVALRIANGAAHAAACSLLLSIMAEFLYRHRGQEQRPPAIALTILVATDISLDIYAVGRPKRKWQALALLLRLLAGLGYIAMFLVYVGFREVFPYGYSYWGMDSAFSNPVIYIFLWVIGIWDLLHTSIHRHTLGRDLRTGMLFPRRARRPTRSGVPQPSNPLSAPRTRGSHPQTPSHLERGFGTDATIALGEIHSGEKGNTQVNVVSRSGSSSTSGESSSSSSSSSQAAPAGNLDSKTVSAGTSRRTSTAFSENTLEEVEGGTHADVAREDSKP